MYTIRKKSIYRHSGAQKSQTSAEARAYLGSTVPQDIYKGMSDFMMDTARKVVSAGAGGVLLDGYGKTRSGGD